MAGVAERLRAIEIGADKVAFHRSSGVINQNTVEVVSCDDVALHAVR